jgi:hypothetical protein
MEILRALRVLPGLTTGFASELGTRHLPSGPDIQGSLLAIGLIIRNGGGDRMPTDYRKLGELVGYQLVTTDRGEAALRDVVIDAAAWEARYLVAGADAWAPNHEVLVAVRSLTGVDDARREIALELPSD